MPPPLPPKKKHIMSYMEMFGRSLNNTDEELVQSLTRTKDLLEAVWQQNYHDYSYNSMSSQYDLSSGGFAGKEKVVGHFNPGLFNLKLQPRTFQPLTFQHSVVEKSRLNPK